MQNKNLNIEFDIAPLATLVDIYFDHFLKLEIRNLIERTDEKSQELSSNINELITSNCLLILNNYISKSYLHKLNHYVTDEGITLFILNRLHSKISDL
jgi:hypothetical protein